MIARKEMFPAEGWSDWVEMALLERLLQIHSIHFNNTEVMFYRSNAPGPYLRGLRVQTPRNYNKKIFSLYKNYMLHNMWPLVLGQMPLKCQEKPSSVHKMQQTIGAAGAPPWTLLGSLKCSPRPLAGGEGAGCPPPKNPTPLSAFQASGFSPLGLASPCPKFSNSLRSKILHTALRCPTC